MVCNAFTIWFWILLVSSKQYCLLMDVFYFTEQALLSMEDGDNSLFFVEQWWLLFALGFVPRYPGFIVYHDCWNKAVGFLNFVSGLGRHWFSASPNLESTAKYQIIQTACLTCKCLVRIRCTGLDVIPISLAILWIAISHYCYPNSNNNFMIFFSSVFLIGRWSHIQNLQWHFLSAFKTGVSHECLHMDHSLLSEFLGSMVLFSSEVDVPNLKQVERNTLLLHRHHFSRCLVEMHCFNNMTMNMWRNKMNYTVVSKKKNCSISKQCINIVVIHKTTLK